MNRSVATFLFLAFALHAASVQAEELFIKAGRVYTMTGAPLAPGQVIVRDGKIARVGADLTVPAGARVIDLGTGVLLPGLVDAYSHAGLTEGVAEQTREITPSFRTLDAIDWRARVFREARAEGTTCMTIAPGTDNVFEGLGCTVKTAPAKRIVQAETGLWITMASDPASGNSARQRPDSIYIRQPTNRMGVVWLLRSTLDRAPRQRTPELAPVRDALEGKRRIFAISRTESDLLALLRIAREFHFTPTIVGGQEAYKIVDELRAVRVPVILAPMTTSPRETGLEESKVVWNEPALLHQAGIPFALAGRNLLEQARFAARYGLPADEALRAITLSPAKLLGLESRIGSIAVGRDADLVALDGDPLELASSIKWVLINGTFEDR